MYRRGSYHHGPSLKHKGLKGSSGGDDDIHLEKAVEQRLELERTSACPKRGTFCKSCAYLYKYIFHFCQECGQELKPAVRELCPFAEGTDGLPLTRL